jgi:hypothetical protein
VDDGTGVRHQRERPGRGVTGPNRRWQAVDKRELAASDCTRGAAAALTSDGEALWISSDVHKQSPQIPELGKRTLM